MSHHITHSHAQRRGELRTKSAALEGVPTETELLQSPFFDAYRSETAPRGAGLVAMYDTDRPIPGM